MISNKYGLLNSLLDDGGNLPEPPVFRKRVSDLPDADLRQILHDMDRLLFRSELNTAMKKVEALRAENHKLRRRLQNVLMQAELDVESTPVDGNVNHVNYKNTNHITGKFKKDLLKAAAEKTCCDESCKCFHCAEK
jgi:regulator of replication initiation timing